ncbi:MAG: hypothetical protein KA165_10705 [Saprospiraceae bacterium]|nr:hypothetical protein [Saprospiraceae bacterium]
MQFLSWLFPFREKGSPEGRYTQLNAAMILKTIERLEQRINVRFPDSGLGRVCSEFRALSYESESLARRLGPPIWPVRIAAWLAAVLLIGLVIWASGQMVQHFSFSTAGMPDLLQTMESAINELIFLGLALFSLVSLETRIKQRSALAALHRLRSIAHVVDMHQLTKDPAYLVGPFTQTQASPERTLTRQQLTRYLDYCSEMLALNSKIAALFAQNMEDPVVLNAVNDLESLTQGMAAKIWQKIMILDLSDE